MFKKKAKRVVADDPIREKLEEAYQKITDHIQEFKDGHLQTVTSGETNWKFKVYDINGYLKDRQCKSKDQARTLREIALKQYAYYAKELAIAEAQFQEMQTYKSTIGEALAKIGSMSSLTELQQRINALQALETMQTSSAHLSPMKKHEIYSEIRPTLFAVEALISLQKEDQS